MTEKPNIDHLIRARYVEMGFSDEMIEEIEAFTKAKAEEIKASRKGLVRECCRECRDKEPPEYTRAEFILWGKLLPPEALGPRCYEHAADRLGWQAMSRIDQYAVYDLRPINRLIWDDNVD